MSNTDSLDSPRPELGGSHHLPPYSILCVVPPHPLSELSRFGLPGLWEFITPSSDLRLGWGLKQTCSYLKGFPTMCCIPSAHTEIRLIPNFLWLGVKLPVWLLALPSTITFAANVQMAYAKPFSTSTLQGLSNGIKNTSRRGVLISTIELWSYGSPRGLQVPTFGSVSFILTLASKWGCDTCQIYLQVVFLGWVLNTSEIVFV